MPVTYLIANLPLTFEPNEGQTDAQVKFIGRGMGLTVLLTPRWEMTLRPSAGQIGECVSASAAMKHAMARSATIRVPR